jgi:hypothetical protein
MCELKSEGFMKLQEMFFATFFALHPPFEGYISGEKGPFWRRENYKSLIFG